ncbi:MAG: hypothetical protein IKN72_02455 [Clostridia bacterium]|nr:hypothetical protein [Clostridia bacterium]
MEQQLNDAFRLLRDEELARFLTSDVSEPTDAAFNALVLKETLRKAGLAPAGKDMTMKQKMKSAKWLRTVLIAAVVAAVAAVGAFAAVHFNVPQAFIEQLGLTEAHSDLAASLPQRVEADGLIVTLETVLTGKQTMPCALQNENGTPKADRTYAIVSIRKADGSPVLSPDEVHGARFGYTLLVNGYAPNPNMFAEGRDVYYYEDTETVWRAYDVTDALAFSDRGVSLIVSDGMVTGPEALRIDKNGAFYWADGYDGIKAIFALSLDPALADAKKQAELTDEAWNSYDQIVERFRADGLDYDSYTLSADVTAESEEALPTTAPATP